MMKKQIVVMFVVWLFTTCNLLDVNAQQFRDYVVITSKEMQSDKAWMKVVEVLSKRHKATVLYYDKQLRELLAELRRLTPRYVAVVEKPEPAKAPSNMSIVGRYVLSQDIWPLLGKTAPGAGDEIQLTDAIAMLIEKNPVEAYRLVGRSHDCGDKMGYMKAFVEYSMRHKHLGREFSDWLKTLQN